MAATVFCCQVVDFASGSEPKLDEFDVFTSGKDGYHTYRIPSVIVTQKGTLLAFCEGRKKSSSDTGDIDLVMKRSADGGKTWSKMEILWDDGGNTCGNPCPVVDESNGTIWLLLTWNSGKIGERDIKPGFGEDSRRVFVSHSTDDGKTWTEPADITADTKKKEWSWYATGPGAGIQVQKGKYAGRMVIPCDHKEPTTSGVKFYSHVIYSDDHGKTWKLGGRSPEDLTNESEVVELSDGTLLLNMRNYDREIRARQICFSKDGGETWTDQQHDKTLIAPTCQASIRRIRWPGDGEEGLILFSNPASTSARKMLTVRGSTDDCKTWSVSRVLQPGSAAYSCLTAMPDGDVGCLYERDDYKKISFARFNLDWLYEKE